MDRFVCSNHFSDTAIKKYIKSHSNLGTCDYCHDNRVRRVIALNDLSEFMTEAIGRYYDDAANWLGYDSAEGGYLGSTFDTYDILFNELELDIDDPKLQDDLYYSMPDTVWCHQDPYGLSQSEEMDFDWKYFKNVVKHKARYSFFYIKKVKDEGFAEYTVNISDILTEIAGLISKYKLITTLSGGEVFYRCRQHNVKDEVAEARDIAAPPTANAIYSNRMSPAGISMFYAGFDTDTSVLETVDSTDVTNPYYTVGRFSSNNNIMVVDFSKLPVRPSIFDTDKQDDYHPITFLRKLVADLSQPVAKDGREHIEYVPTQIITEYIRYILSRKPKHKVGGIVYPSAKDLRKKACVLFLDNEETLKELKFEGFERKDYNV